MRHSRLCGCDELGDFDNCQDMTFLTEPVNVVSPGVTYHKTPDVLVGSVYEYDHHGGNHCNLLPGTPVPASKA